MTKEQFDKYQEERHKERLRRYKRLFSTEDGKWVLEDLKAKTIYNTAASKDCVLKNNPLSSSHLTGQRDLIAWVMLMTMADMEDMPTEAQGDM